MPGARAPPAGRPRHYAIGPDERRQAASRSLSPSFPHARGSAVRERRWRPEPCVLPHARGSAV